MNRRTFSKLIAGGVGAAGLPALKAASTRNLTIGCAGLAWNVVPRSPELLETAVQDISSLGFYGFETFAEVLLDWDKKGTLHELLEKHRLQLKAGYCGVNLVDPSARKENVDKIILSGKVIRKYNGTFGVLASNGVKRDTYEFKEHKADIIRSLNDYGMALNDLGLGAGLHQHTGTAVETHDEVYAVMESVNTKHVKFAPDVGQLQKGGSDAAQVIKDFLPIVAHMHLKDYAGTPEFDQYYAGYCPLGEGKVDIPAILDMVESAHHHPDVIFELDRSAKAPLSALETARISKVYLQGLGYKFKG